MSNEDEATRRMDMSRLLHQRARVQYPCWQADACQGDGFIRPGALYWVRRGFDREVMRYCAACLAAAW